MANHKSAIKKYKRDEKKRIINKANRSKMRNKIKKFTNMVNDSKLEEAKSFFPGLCSIIDKTVSKGVIHKRTAARYKSRLSHLLQKQLKSS